MTPSNSDIPQKIQELQSTQSQVRFWRTLTIIAIILVVVTCVGLISTAVNQLTTSGSPVQKVFLEDLSAGVTADIVPELQRLASNAASDIAPLVQQELAKLNEMAPVFADSAREELHLLAINVSANGEKAIDETVGKIISSRQEWILNNFDGVTKEKAQTMTENLTLIAHERVEHIADTLFADQIVALNRITENLEKIKTAELANVEHEVPNWEMGLLFFDIIRDELRGMETLNTDTSALDDKVVIVEEETDETE